MEDHQPLDMMEAPGVSHKERGLPVSMNQERQFLDSQPLWPKREISVIRELMRKFMALLLTINLSFLNHGEELRKLTQLTDSRTQTSNGSTNQLPSLSTNTDTTTDINITPKILVTKVLMRRSTVSPQLTNQFFPNHGEELRSPIQRTDSRTHLGNGSTNLPLLKRTSLTKTSETRRSMRKFTDSLPTSISSSHNQMTDQALQTLQMVI